MKKCLFLGAMAAMLLGTASCSSDMEPAMGGEMPVSFSVSLGDDIDSRTISDGLKANQLKFAVFENGTEIPKLAQTVDVVDKKATVTTRLVKGHTYKFVFWAQNSACTAYNTSDMSAIKVDYTSVNCNDESRDAFYKMDEITVTKAFEQEEVLTRPFAQINFLASDAAGVVNVDQYQSQVTVTGVPTTLNTLDGTVTDPTEVTTYAYTTIPKETLEGYETYKYVAMNYVLAATNKEMKTEVALTVKDEKGAEVNTVTVANCPVQRNYRTNIFGDLFTLQGKFNITIDPIYNTPDYEVELVEATPVSTEKELREALTATGKSTISVKLMNDVDLHYGARVGYGDASTKDIIIDGNGHNLKLHGTDTDWSSFGALGDANLTIKNATITKEEPGNSAWNNHAINFANRVETGKDPLGTGKIYLKNCDFSNLIAISNDAEIENCNFTEVGGYYLIMINANVNNTIVKNCTFYAPNDGRGIKVNDQYIGEADRVQCNINISDCRFETANKAAILVTNTAGAKITASNLDITKVAKDQVNAVWNDEDRKDAYDLVEVFGCTKKQE